VLSGTCGACHRVTTLVEGSLPLGAHEAAPGEATAPADRAAREGAPECAECGSLLAITASDDGLLEVHCSECETTTTFVPRGSERAPERRPTNRFERTGGPGEGRPNARPCRQCGAPLRFTTDENGVLTGECDACGNRFTLPPRRESRDDRFPARRPSGYGRGAGRPDRRGGRPYFPRESRGGDRDDRRRRPEPKRRRKYGSDSD